MTCKERNEVENMTQLQRLLTKKNLQNDKVDESQPAVSFAMMVFPLGARCLHVIFRSQRAHWTELGGSLHRPRPWPLVGL